MGKLRDPSQQGFTLVELVVVIAILGVLAATATPMVSNFLGNSKEQAYNADRASLQSAIDAFYSSPNNPRFMGKRQFPIKGVDSSGVLEPWSDSDVESDIISPKNPLMGTNGGEPTWQDDGDGIRTEENLNAASNSLSGAGFGWFVDKVNLNGSEYSVDTRDYFIDFGHLVASGLLANVPTSASSDNAGVESAGSYSWYVNPRGRVTSLYVHFPSRKGAPGFADNRGFISGVYP